MCVENADWLECCQIWKPYGTPNGNNRTKVCDQPNYPACLEYRLVRRDLKKCQIHAPKIAPMSNPDSDLAKVPSAGVSEARQLERNGPTQSDSRGQAGKASARSAPCQSNNSDAALQQSQAPDQNGASSQAADTPRSRARALRERKEQFKAEARAQCPDLNEDQIEETWARARGQTWAEWWGEVSSDNS